MRRRIFLTILAVAVVTVILFGVPLAVAVERRNASDAVLELQRIGGTAAGHPDHRARGRSPAHGIEFALQLTGNADDGRITRTGGRHI